MPKIISPEIKQKMIEKYLSGVSGDLLSKEFGSKAQTITKIVKEAGHEIRGPKKKLTEEDKEQIIKLYESGLGGNRIAEKFNVGHVTINRFLRKKGVTIRGPEQCHRADEK